MSAKPLLAVLFVFAFVGFANAVPPEVCGPNGYYDSSIDDCRFFNEPNGSIYCNGAQSKYHSACVGPNYYDYDSYSYYWSGYIRGHPYSGQVCEAQITYNDPRCTGGGSYSGSREGGSGGSSNYYYSYNDYYYNSYGGYCGNGYCEYGYGENAYTCLVDCYNPFGRGYYSSCNLYSYPTSIYAGGWSDVQVQYVDLFYEPGLIPVNCGNGYVAYAYNAYGTTGTAYARCYFPYAGTFYQTAYAGGIGCSPSRVLAVYGSGGSGGGSGGSGGGGSQQSGSCAVITNPSSLNGNGSSFATVVYQGFSSSVRTAQVICGNGQQANVQCDGGANGDCNALECVYSTPPSFPKRYDVKAIVNGQQCSSSGVNIYGNNPTPTPTAQPEFGGIVLTVKTQGGSPVSGAFVVLFYYGQAVLTAYTDASGVASFSSLPVGSYSLTVSKTGFETQTAGAVVVANENAEVEVILERANAFKSCSVSLNPSTVRPGEQTTVSVAYSGFANAPQSALVSCAGQQLQAQCTGNSEGVCTTQCAFAAEQSYPQTKLVSSSIEGTNCASAQATLIAPLPTQGTVLTRVTECASGSPLQSASVMVNGTQAYTDSSGVATAISDPGFVSIVVSKNGFLPEQTTAFVEAGRTVSKSVCLNTVQSACDFEAELVHSPQCPYSQEPEPYQVKLTNKNATGNTLVQIQYSNDVLSGPSSVLLAPSQQTIVEFNSTLRNLGGSRNAIVSFISSICSKNIAIQACMSGGLEVEAIRDRITALPGERACFDLLVRNRGLASSPVTMSYSSSDSSLTGEFSEKQFRITPQENKQVDFCVDAKGSGLKSFTITASSEINDASESVTLDIPSLNVYLANGGTCVDVSALDTVESVPVALTNNGVSGDYEVEMVSLQDDEEENPLQAEIIQNKIYGFEKGTTRNVYVSLDPFDAEAGEHRFDLLLKKDGIVVSQQTICFDVEDRKMQSVSLTPLSLTIQSGKSASAFLNVENTGNRRLLYSVVVSNVLPIQIYPQNFRLEPGEFEKVELQVSAPSSVRLGSYTIPIRLASSSRDENKYSVDVNCGNGRTKTIQCEGGESSCGATCDYPDAGEFTATSSIAGKSCSSTTVRVVENFTDRCFLSLNPTVTEEDEFVSVTVNYRDLSKGAQNNFTIDCGNGNRVTAENCVGTSGSCSARCLYDREGSYTVTGSSSNYSCLNAQVAIMDENEGEGVCRLSTQTNVAKGTANTITLSYDVSDLPSERQELLSSQSLLVNVVSSATRFEPEISEAIQITAPSVVEVTPGSTTFIPVTIKNNDVFSLNTVLVYLVNLPTGVQAERIQAFSLQPKSQLTKNIVLIAAPDAPLQSTAAKLKVESGAFVAPDKQISVVVKKPSAELLLVDVAEPSFSFDSKGNSSEITVRLPVTNNAPRAVTVTSFASVPEGWRFGSTPVSIKPGETVMLEFKLASDAYEDKDFEVLVNLQSDEGKIKSVPIRVPSKSSASGLTGLFTGLFASSTGGILLLLLVIGMGLAAFLYYASREMKEKIGEDEAQKKLDKEKE
ncbi:MAG: carboxypeptidase regulatory-like domain-containing protein [Candidatus Norongarragalinales archaeon]